MELSTASYLRLAAPFALASITNPLLGAVGTAVVGHLGRVDYIGAVALGAVIFSTIYWLFNFLRLITSSYSSQAKGRGNRQETNLALLRPSALALAAGLVLIIISPFIFEASMIILSPEAKVRDLTEEYFYILIWNAPLVLLNFVVMGWLMGQMKFKAVMLTQVGINILNCLLCALLVLGCGLAVTGVALAVLISQNLGFLVSMFLVFRTSKFYWREELPLVFQKKAFSDLMSTNFYLLIRTICMLVMINLFMSRSTAFGGVTLAANAILFQIQYVLGDFFEGLANAASVYSGLALGHKDKNLFLSNMKISAVCTMTLGAILALIWFWGDGFFLGLFTDLDEVLLVANQYSIYLVLFPLISGMGIVYYGIFNGALKTRLVCWSMLLTVALYLSADRLLVPIFANHGLWLSFIAFYVGRSSFLLMMVPALFRRIHFKDWAENALPTASAV